MIVELQNLSKFYRTKDVETVALDGLDLSIGEGEFLGIMGPSGCGKSTLLNIIGLLDSSSEGKHIFKGQDVSNRNESQLNRIRKSDIGFIFQSFNLIDELTVFENIEVALLYHKISRKVRTEKVNAVMEKIGIAHRTSHHPSQLSGGQQQRVAVARAIVADPALILADEPTGNLDSVYGKKVMELLQDLNNEGRTIVMVTHSEEHAKYAGRLIQLLDGKIIS